VVGPESGEGNQKRERERVGSEEKRERGDVEDGEENRKEERRVGKEKNEKLILMWIHLLISQLI
jgi:hypothetical protein